MNKNVETIGSLKRIIARKQLKDRVKFLETMISLHQPLVTAMSITKKAFQDGGAEGLRQAEEQRSAKMKESSYPSMTPTSESGPQPEIAL